MQGDCIRTPWGLTCPPIWNGLRLVSSFFRRRSTNKSRAAVFGESLSFSSHSYCHSLSLVMSTFPASPRSQRSSDSFSDDGGDPESALILVHDQEDQDDTKRSASTFTCKTRCNLQQNPPGPLPGNHDLLSRQVVPSPFPAAETLQLA